MRLGRLLSLKSETQGELEKYKDSFLTCEVEKEKLQQILREGKDSHNRETLLVAATEETISMAKEYGVAILGYCKAIEQSPLEGKTRFLRGVEYVVEGFEEVEASFLEKIYQRHHRLPWIIAETKRCMIRELCMEDIDDLFTLYQDKELTKYVDPLKNYEEEKELQQAYIDNMYHYFGYGMWLVFLKETGELIGRAGLEHREIETDTVHELGYLIKKNYQRQGLAREVCLAIVKYAEEELGIEELNCFIKEGNIASVKLAENLGFSYESTIVEQDRKLLRFIRK